MAQLAQVNVSRMKAAVDSPTMRGFVAAADPTFRLAESSPGFVWRLTGERGNVHVHAGNLVVNLSVWRSYEDLHAFVYRSVHGGLVRRRSEWFLPTPSPSTALWWVADGERPTVDEALRRLALLRQYGPSPQAFSLRRRFPPPAG